MPVADSSLSQKNTDQTSFSYDVCIIGGCGHVGLPLGIAFAESGLKVALYDINQASADKVNAKHMPFLEEGAQPLLEKLVDSKHLVATTDTDVISKSQNLIMVIGTPVDEHLNPKVHEVFKAIDDIEPFLSSGQLLILRSTLFPGVTEKIGRYLQAKQKTIDIAFCPERIAEGKALTELYSLPQIVSGVTTAASQRASQLFGNLTKEVIELAPTEAELAKLFTNTWRYINFAISNQFYRIAAANGMDFYKIHDAMTRDYPRLKAFAKAGFAAGPCLFKDTMQLSAYDSGNFFLGHAAMLINEGLPNFIVEQLKESTDLKTKTVGILGMAFKANSDDPRESLSYKLKKILEIEAASVVASDAYIKQPGLVTAQDVIKDSDIIILAAPHDDYQKLDFDGKQVIDIWNFYGQGGLI